MTADAFIEWAAEQPRGRFEFARGEIVAMAPERLGTHPGQVRSHVRASERDCRPETRCEAIGDGFR